MSETVKTVYMQFTDCGEKIRKWDRKPFDGGGAYKLTGWEPIDSAPRGDTIKKTHHKTGKEYDTFAPVRVLTWRSGGERMMSRFLPQGTEGARDGDRWEGYTRDHPPTHWLRGSETQPQEHTNG